MGDRVESLAKVEINNIHCFPLRKTVLTTPGHLLVLRMLGKGFQDELLPHLPRNQGEADQSVVLWILLLVLPEDSRGICFLPVPGGLSPSP